MYCILTQGLLVQGTARRPNSPRASCSGFRVTSCSKCLRTMQGVLVPEVPKEYWHDGVAPVVHCFTDEVTDFWFTYQHVAHHHLLPTGKKGLRLPAYRVLRHHDCVMKLHDPGAHLICTQSTECIFLSNGVYGSPRTPRHWTQSGPHGDGYVSGLGTPIWTNFSFLGHEAADASRPLRYLEFVPTHIPEQYMAYFVPEQHIVSGAQGCPWALLEADYSLSPRTKATLLSSEHASHNLELGDLDWVLV